MYDIHIEKRLLAHPSLASLDVGFSTSLVSTSPMHSQEDMLNGMGLVEAIRHSLVGRDATIATPYGHRHLVYADYTASGRMLSFVEAYMNVWGCAGLLQYAVFSALVQCDIGISH